MKEKTDVSFGGQAVIEGVMMRSPNFYSVATLKNKKVKVKLEKAPMLSKKPFFNWFIVRGIVGMVEMLYLGMKALTYSANETAPKQEKLSKTEIFYSLALALVFGVLIFVVAPLFLTKFLVKSTGILFDITDGIIRVIFFFVYLYLIQLSGEIKRIFEFHGAEHSTINAYEHNKKLTVENVKKFATFHPRCGTSFILIVLVVSIIVFSAIVWQNIWIKLIGRIILLPFVAGLSYEFLKLSAKIKGPLSLIFTIPGRLVQKVTTKKPDDLQIKAAIYALNAVINAENKLNKSRN
jgi:uncharacterized protein YqhQ